MRKRPFAAICTILFLVLAFWGFALFLDAPFTETVIIEIPPKDATVSDNLYIDNFHFSNDEFITVGNSVCVVAGQDLGDSMVVLKPVKVREENAYEPTYITPGMEVEIDVEKGTAFRIGVMYENMQNTPKTIELSITGIKLD